MTTKSERLVEIQRILLAHPQGLTEAEIARRLGFNRSTVNRYLSELSGTLPIWEDEKGALGLQVNGYLKSLGLTSLDENLSKLISEGENNLLEFKVSACWDDYNKTKNNKLTINIVRTIVGFMNSRAGGTLLIGVADNGDIIGLEKDYLVADRKKQNRDGYQLFLANMLNDNLGGECISFYKINFQEINDKEICSIQVQPASKPIYYKGEFYVRNGNQTLLLNTQAAVEYIKHRWK